MLTWLKRVSVCLPVSVRLSRSVSLCLGRAGHTDEHTHDVNNATVSLPAGITSTANVWSNFNQVQKIIVKHS